MISNCGIKGALIANDGLKGQYLEDLPPDDGSQRLYNLRDYSARFGGATNLAESSILLEDGRLMSMYSYLETRPFTVHACAGQGVSVVPNKVDESITILPKASSGAKSLGVVYQVAGYQSFSAVLSRVRVGVATNYTYNYSMLRLFSGDDPSSVNYDTPETFLGVEIYRAATQYYLCTDGDVGVAGKTPLALPGVVEDAVDPFVVSYDGHDQTVRVVVDGVVVGAAQTPPPTKIYFGLGDYAKTVLHPHL